MDVLNMSRSEKRGWAFEFLRQYVDDCETEDQFVDCVTSVIEELNEFLGYYEPRFEVKIEERIW